MSNEPSKSPGSPPPGWGIARPEKPPGPTVCPAAMALGITILVWGFITSAILTAFGVVIFAASLAVWIQEIRHERKS